MLHETQVSGRSQSIRILDNKRQDAYTQSHWGNFMNSKRNFVVENMTVTKKLKASSMPNSPIRGSPRQTTPDISRIEDKDQASITRKTIRLPKFKFEISKPIFNSLRYEHK